MRSDDMAQVIEFPSKAGHSAMIFQTEPMTMTQLIAKRLKQWRESCGLTQAELARKARGVSARTISRLENGEVSAPRRGTIERIEKALDVDPGDLTGEKPIPENLGRPNGSADQAAYQINVRVGPVARNAFSLAALRYGIPVSSIVELAPLLFVIAAEGSLKRRHGRLAELKDAFGRVSGLRQNFPHLPFWIAETFEQNEPIEAEAKSIRVRDLFGETIPDYVFDAYQARDEKRYDEDRENPFVTYLRDSVGDAGDIQIDAVGPNETDYAVCRSEVLELVGGDETLAEKLADNLWSGRVLIHQMPRELLNADAVAKRVEWVRNLPEPKFLIAEDLDI
jgi:transcriptional regulator with XRE-family HTH domain